MIKIKKFFKKHYKKIITVFCVVISLIAFSFCSFAEDVNNHIIYEQQFDFVQMQLMKNSTHNTVTVRGYNPQFLNYEYGFHSYPSNYLITNRWSAVFAFAEYEKVTFRFQNQYMSSLLNYNTGAILIEFDFSFAGKSIEYLEVVGFNVGRGYDGNSLSGTFNGNDVRMWNSKVKYSPGYDNITITRRNGTFVSEQGASYSSYIFHVHCVVPIKYSEKFEYIEFTLGFEGAKNSSNTSYRMTNYNGFTYYSNINDVPTAVKPPSSTEVNDIQKENQLTDDIVNRAQDGLNTFSDLMNLRGQQSNSILGLLEAVSTGVFEPAFNLPKISNLLAFSLTCGCFMLVFNIASSLYQKIGGDSSHKGKKGK